MLDGSGVTFVTFVALYRVISNRIEYVDFRITISVNVQVQAQAPRRVLNERASRGKVGIVVAIGQSVVNRPTPL
jgi:hypothetical protein